MDQEMQQKIVSSRNQRTTPGRVMFDDWKAGCFPPPIRGTVVVIRIKLPSEVQRNHLEP